MSDLISRQAAIDAIKTWGLIDGLSEGQAIEILADEEKLPTAQPEILACGKGELNVPGTNVGDMISRQAAIDALCKGCGSGYCGISCEEYMAIKNLPSAQPRMRGKWVKISPANIYECSQCGKYVMTDDISEYDFCHGCGADMRQRGEQDE